MTFHHDEQWREIPGWPGYEASTLGNIRSYWAIGKRSRLVAVPHPMKATKNADGGTLRITLCGDGSQAGFSVAALVLMTFVGPRPYGCYPSHLDDDQDNVSAANLTWGARTGKHWKKRGGRPEGYVVRKPVKRTHRSPRPAGQVPDGCEA